jgi:cobalt-zinc-cadmium efflux system membrane fusion protein
MYLVRQVAVAIVACLLCPTAMPLVAHEGHQPLPTKGVQVDTARGKITLSKQARDSIGLVADEVTVGNVATLTQVFAETVAPWQSTAFGSAQISGRIAKLLVRPGDHVNQDQIVAELSSRELELLRGEVLQARREYQLNERLLDITRPTARSGAVPMQRLLDLETALEQSQNRMDIAIVRSQSLGMGVDHSNDWENREMLYPIRSPIAGLVVHSDLAEGKFVEAFEHLFEIVNTDQTWVRLQVLEKDSFKINTGSPVSIHFPDASVTIDSVIDRIDAGFDTKTKIISAWSTVSNPKVIPGMVGKAEIQTSQGEGKLAVPHSAVFSDGLQNYVFVEEASTRNSSEYQKKFVKLGHRVMISDRSSESLIEVVQGDIYPGDRIVRKGGHELSSLFFLGVLKLADADKKRLGITTSRAAMRELSQTSLLPATIVLPPANRMQLSSQLSGTIKSHSLSPGKVVKTGEPLVSIASPEFFRMQLDLISAVLEGRLLRRRAERLETIQGDAISTRAVLEIQSQAEQQEIRSQGLQRELLSLGLLPSEVQSIIDERRILDSLPLRSTINGAITSSAVTLGDTVSASQALVEIQDLSQFWIEANAPSSTTGTLNVGAMGIATFLANSDLRIPVKLTRISPIIDETTRTQRLWFDPASSNAAPKMRAGMMMTVSVSLEPGVNCLSVPIQAIIKDGTSYFAFVEKENGYVERRRVVIGRSDLEHVEILQGIVVGEMVIVSGSRGLQTAFASLR